LDAEVGQHRFQHAGIFLQRLVGQGMGVLHRHRLGQQVQRRQLVLAIGQVQRGLALGALAGRRRAGIALDAVLLALGQTGGGDRFGPRGAGAVVVILGIRQVIGALVIVFVFAVLILMVVIARAALPGE